MKKTRHSIRLRGYDYRQAGAYFITLCTQNWICYFGHISDGKMILNDAGRMVEHWYRELESKFPGVKCDTHVTMPNHFHAIIHITGTDDRKEEGEHAGSPQRETGTGMGERTEQGEHAGSPQHVKNELDSIVGADRRVCPDGRDETPNKNSGCPNEKCPSISGVVQWFKTMTTNAYIRGIKKNNWSSFIGRLWQRNYYEHIIRDDHEFAVVSNYIESNPANWNTDSENPLLINQH